MAYNPATGRYDPVVYGPPKPIPWLVDPNGGGGPSLPGAGLLGGGPGVPPLPQIDPSQFQLMPPVMPPAMGQPRKPSILERLFPGASAGGLLSPDEAQAIRRQALLQLGTNLMRLGGPSLVRQGFLPTLGTAFQGVDLQGMVADALKLKAYQQQVGAVQGRQQALAAVAAKWATTADPRQRLQGMIGDLATTPGMEEIV